MLSFARNLRTLRTPECKTRSWRQSQSVYNGFQQNLQWHTSTYRRVHTTYQHKAEQQPSKPISLPQLSETFMNGTSSDYVEVRAIRCFEAL